jgi:single-stranded DNA-binding protein
MKKQVTTAAAPASAGASTPWAVNRVHLVGRLAADPATRETTAGLVTKLRVVTNSGRTPEFHDVSVWGEHAADCA